MNNNGCIIPEITEQNVDVQQENATFMVIGDKAYTSEIIEEYNRNAAAKTEEFNTNATNKTNDFNANYNNKLKAFNDNATTKTTDFDSHVTAQTTNFNNNAETATANFNKNAVQQTDEFNKNAASYNESIQDNKKQIVSTRDELYRLKTDVLETGENTDTFVHLEDSAMAELQELSVEGVCEQETTVGKNLLNIENYSKSETLIINSINNHEIKFTTSSDINYEQTIYFNDVLLKANTTYSIIRTKSSEIPSELGVLELYKGETWIKVILSGTVNSSTFTVDEDNIYKIRIKLANNNQKGYTGTISNIMVSESGGEYEPYTGGQPSPNPDYPQEIKTITDGLKITSCAENLYNIKDKLVFTDEVTIDDEDWITITCDNSSGTTTKFFDFKTRLSHSVKPNTQYDLFIEIKSVSGAGNFNFVSNQPIGQSNTYFGNSLINLNVGTLKSTFTTKSDFTGCTSFLNSYATFTAGRSGSITFRLSVLNKTTKTLDNFIYQSYISSQIQVNLGTEFIGGINENCKDTLGIRYNKDDGQYHLILNKTIGKIILDGINTTFTASSISLHNGKYTTCNYPNPNIGIAPNDSVIQTKSDKPIGTSLYNTWQGEIMYSISCNNKTSYLQICLPSTFTTAEQINNWLNSNQSIVYYMIAEPYEVDLGTVDMLLSYDEITNIFTDSDLFPKINTKYYRNFITTIRNLQVNNDTLKNELVNIENRLSALETANTNKASDIPTKNESEVSE